MSPFPFPRGNGSRIACSLGSAMQRLARMHAQEASPADDAGPPLPLAERAEAEQIGVLFKSVTLGVVSAACGAVGLSLAIYRLGFLDPRTGCAWVFYIMACAAAHIALHQRYVRSKPSSSRWRYWGAWFSVFSLAEGMGWGWATIGLVNGGGFEVELLTLVVTLGVAAGAVPVFSPYLPAFFTFFIPATLPYAIISLTAQNKVQHASALLMLIFIGAVGGLGVLANRALKHMIRLRIHTEEMAVDLGRQKEIAEEASRAKSMFLAAASHDLRQPIHALSLFVGALRHVPMPAEGQRLIEQIEASSNSMDSLFSALLDISRLDAGVVDVQRRIFRIGAVLRRVCSDYAEDSRLKGIELAYVGCTALVNSDPVLVERIVRNLVANAVRYTQHGKIVVGCRRRGDRIAVQVWDTGRGIPPDQIEQVFQEFYQLDNPERDREKGLGLGLAIVRRLTVLLGCELNVRSEVGKGSYFEFTLVRAVGAADAEEPASDESVVLKVGGLVVVVDDEQRIRDAMSTLLQRWGYDVVTAGSADEAVQLLVTRPVRPDLLISDFRLRNGENGVAAIEQLRMEYNEAIPGMLITGDTAPERLTEAQASGLVLLHKPVPNGRLRSAINNLIATGAHEQQRARSDI